MPIKLRSLTAPQQQATIEPTPITRRIKLRSLIEPPPPIEGPQPFIPPKPQPQIIDISEKKPSFGQKLLGAVATGAGEVQKGLLSTAKQIDYPISVAGAKLQELLTGREVDPSTSPIQRGLETQIGKFERGIETAQEPLRDLGTVGRIGFGAVQAIPQILPALATGGGAVGLGTLGTTAFGGKAREIERAGGTPLQQVLGGGLSAGLEIATEAIPLQKLTQLVKGSARTGRTLAESALAEFVGEATAEALNPFIDRATYNKEAELASLRQIAEAGATGAVASVLLGGAAIGSQKANQAIANKDFSPQTIQEVNNEVEQTTGANILEQAQEPTVEPTIPPPAGLEINVNRMSEQQLKTELLQQGLDTTGTKTELRNRLKSAREVVTQPIAPQVTKEAPIEPLAPSRAVSRELLTGIKPVTTQEAFFKPEVPKIEVARPAKLTPNVPLKEVTQLPNLEPIETKSRVLTEAPKMAKPNIADVAERVYQEIFSTNIPFEKIGGPARTQGSNLNRVQGTIEYNTVAKQTDMQGNEIGKSTVDIFADFPKESKQDLFDRMLNSHNIDRFRQGKPVFGKTVSDVTSAEKVAEYDITNPEFKAKQEEIVKYFKNLQNKWAVPSGLVSQEGADRLVKLYPNYVPTYRAKDLPKSMTQGGQNIAQIIKKAKGSEEFILPIDQQMIALTDRTIKNARKNELMNTIAKAYEAGDSNANRYIKNITDAETKPLDDFTDIGANFDEVPVLKGDEYAVNFYTDGKPRQMIVNKTLFKALENTTSDEGINKVANAVKKYATNPFKQVVTGKNPLFGMSNIMRDVPTALTYSSNPLKMSENIPRAIKEMTTNGELFKKFKAMGGTREGLIQSGKEFKVPNLGEQNKAFKIAQKVNPLNLIEQANNFTETLPRFAEFLTILDATGNPATALYGSAELTTDFSRHGNLTKLVDNFVPYLNPSVQGIDKFRREIKTNPLKTIVKGATVITLPTMLLDLINEDDEDYNNLPARERNLFFNIPYTDKKENKKFIRMPKSRELGVAFSSLYEWAARKSRGQEVTGKEIAQTIAENFTPTDITAPIWTPAKKAWKQIKNPEAYETNFWGGLIVPQSQRRFSPGEQYDLNSSGIAKAVGQQFKISPYVIDYIIKSYGGIVGQEIQPIGAGATTSLPKALLLKPLQKKFITDPVFKSASVEKFYDVLNVAKKEAQDFNRINNVPPDVFTPLERRASELNKLSLQMSKKRAEQKQLQTQKDTEDRIRELQKQINKIAERGIK